MNRLSSEAEDATEFHSIEAPDFSPLHDGYYAKVNVTLNNILVPSVLLNNKIDIDLELLIPEDLAVHAINNVDRMRTIVQDTLSKPRLFPIRLIESSLNAECLRAISSLHDLQLATLYVQQVRWV